MSENVASYLVYLDHPDGPGLAVVRASSEERAKEMALGVALDGWASPAAEGTTVTEVVSIDAVAEGVVLRSLAGTTEARVAVAAKPHAGSPVSPEVVWGDE